MSSDAIVVWKENGHVQSYWNNHIGQSMRSFVFWGLENTREQVRNLYECVIKLDDYYREGGCFIDVDLRRLVFCGGYPDLQEQRVLRRLIEYNWPGWDVQWAPREMYDVLVLAGFDETTVREYVVPHAHADYMRMRSKLELSDLLEPEMRPDWHASVYSVREGRELSAYACSTSCVEEILPRGAKAVVCELPYSWDLPVSMGEWPKEGFHLDLNCKTLYHWQSSEYVWLDLRESWAGWEIVNWRQDYRQHLAIMGKQCTFPARSDRDVMDWFEQMYIGEYPGHPEQQERFHQMRDRYAAQYGDAGE